MVLIEKINQDDMGFTISLVLNCRKITPDVTEPPRFAKMTSPLSDLFGLEIKIDKWYTEHYLVERNKISEDNDPRERMRTSLRLLRYRSNHAYIVHLSTYPH